MGRRFGRCGLILVVALPLTATGCVSLLPRVGEAAANGAPAGAPAKEGDLPPAKAVALCLQLAGNLERTGHLREAAVQLERARAHNPKLDVGHRLAVLYDRAGEFARAEAEFQRALAERPGDAGLLNDLGYCYYNQGNWAEAERHFRLALEVKADHPRAWVNLGMTLGMQGRHDEGLEAFQKVVSPADAYSNLAFLLMTQGKRDQAKQAYRRALELDPSKKLARAALAKLEEAERKPKSEVKAAAATTPAQPPAAGGRSASEK
jgi:Tfp pilus assembly protein PilF